MPDLAPMASTPIPLPRIKESPYTKVCSLRRQSSSPASSLSHNTSDSPTNLQNVFKCTRDSQSLCSPGWDRCKVELDDVFVTVQDTPSATNQSDANAEDDPKSNDCESTRENGANGLVDSTPDSSKLTFKKQEKTSDIEHLSSALSSLMNASSVTKDDPEGNNTSSDSALDNTLQDFEVIMSCEEATEVATSSTATSATETVAHQNYVRTGVRPSLPSPDVLGCGNPFLIFLCLTVLLQHRDSIIHRSLDSNEMAMHFDRLVRKHNVERVLSQARTLYYRYLAHFNSPHTTTQLSS